MEFFKVSTFISLIILNASWGIAIKLSQDGGKYPYDHNCLVVVVEFTKVFLAFAVVRNAWKKIIASWKVGKLFLILGAIYALYNPLYLQTMTELNPGEFQLLYRMQILYTGVLSWIWFKRRLTFLQWISLVLLTAGCITLKSEELFMPSSWYSLTLVTILALISASGSVFSEYLFERSKHHQSESEGKSGINPFVQGFYFGLSNGILNVILTIARRPSLVFHPVDFFMGFDYRTWIVVAFLSTGGIAVGATVKQFGAIGKTFAEVGAMFLTAVASTVIFNDSLTVRYFSALIMVSTSVLMYHNILTLPSPATKLD